MYFNFMFKKPSVIFMFLLILLFQLSFNHLATAKTVEQVAESIKKHPDYLELVNKLVNTGDVDQNDVDAFVQDVIHELSGKQLTEENFDDIALDVVIELVKGKHSELREAVLEVLDSDDIDKILQGEIPPLLQPLTNLIKQEMFSEQKTDTSAPSGSGGIGGDGSTAGHIESDDSLKTKLGEELIENMSQYGKLQYSENELIIDLDAEKLDGGKIILKTSEKIQSYKLIISERNAILLQKQTDKLIIELENFALAILSDNFVGKNASYVALSKGGILGEITISEYTKLISKTKPFVVEIDTEKHDVDYEVVFEVDEIAKLQALPALGIYRFDEKTDEWKYIESEVDVQSKEIKAKADGNGCYVVMEHHKTFADISGHWAQSDVELMASARMIHGISDSEFQPNRSVTRSEFAAMIQKALRLKPSDSVFIDFEDVSADTWYYPAIASVVSAGIASGTSKTEFQPERTITREEMAAMLVNAIDYLNTKRLHADEGYLNDKVIDIFDDKEDISEWALSAVNRAVDLGLLVGKENNKFAPHDHGTRAEAVVMLKRLLTKGGELI